jgi:hypothetical protein
MKEKSARLYSNEALLKYLPQTDTPYLDMELKYRPQMEVTLREGKTIASLRKGEEFMIVPQHCKKVLTICNLLGTWVGLPNESQENLNKTAALHDDDKRLEYRPDEFSQEEKIKLEESSIKAGLDKELLSATKGKFIEENINNVDNLTFPQMILYYADMLVSWKNIVRFEDRMKESKGRNGISEEFFNMEVEFGKKVEKRIFEALPNVIKNEIGTPEQIPDFVKEVLEGV